MPRNSKYRPANTYPAEYLQLYTHVLNTGAKVVVDTLEDRGKCIALVHSLNAWRKALMEENSPLGPQMYAVVATVDHVDGKHCVVVKPRDHGLSTAIKGLNLPDVIPATEPAAEPAEARGQRASRAEAGIAPPPADPEDKPAFNPYTEIGEMFKE